MVDEIHKQVLERLLPRKNSENLLHSHDVEEGVIVRHNYEINMNNPSRNVNRGKEIVKKASKQTFVASKDYREVMWLIEKGHKLLKLFIGVVTNKVKQR